MVTLKLKIKKKSEDLAKYREYINEEAVNCSSLESVVQYAVIVAKGNSDQVLSQMQHFLCMTLDRKSLRLSGKYHRRERRSTRKNTQLLSRTHIDCWDFQGYSCFRYFMTLPRDFFASVTRVPFSNYSGGQQDCSQDE